MNDFSYSRIPILNRIYMLLFVAMPIINQYQFGALSFLQIYTIFGVVLWVLNSREYIVNRKVVFYIMYIVIISIVGYTIAGDDSVSRIILRLISFALLTLNFYQIFPKINNFQYIYKVYTIVIYVVMISLFVQYVLYILANRPTMLLIPGTTLNYNGGVNSSEFMAYTLGRIHTGYYYRPCSIFIEPGFQSMYCAPWLAIRLFKGNEKSWKEMVSPLLVTVAMVLTTSSMGILCSLMLWMVYVVRTFARGNRKNLKTVMFMVPFLLIAGVYLYGEAGVATSIAIKLKSAQNIDTSSSLTWRLLRGIECFKQIGIFQKIFGCGYGDLTSYFNYIHLTTKYDVNLTLIDYMNGISYMFCSIGIIGVLFVASILKTYLPRKRTSVEAKMVLLCLLVIMATAAVFDTDKYFLYVGLIISIATYKQKQEIYQGDKAYV